MIKIKVCGMCDPLNIREIAEANPDFIGFIFYPGSPRYVGKDPDISLFNNVTPGILKTGVFVNEDPVMILDSAIRTNLDILQLHGNESPDYCSHLRSSGLKIIKVFNITEKFDFKLLKPYMPVCDYFLFDTKTDKFGGSGEKFNWHKLEEYYPDKPFFLSGGICPEDTGLIKTIENRGFFGVDLNSRFETAAGLKNVSLVKTFIDQIKKDQI